MDGHTHEHTEKAITKDPFGKPRGPKLEKTNGRYPRYLETDARTDGQTKRGNY